MSALCIVITNGHLVVWQPIVSISYWKRCRNSAFILANRRCYSSVWGRSRWFSFTRTATLYRTLQDGRKTYTRTFTASERKSRWRAWSSRSGKRWCFGPSVLIWQEGLQQPSSIKPGLCRFALQLHDFAKLSENIFYVYNDIEFFKDEPQKMRITCEEDIHVTEEVYKRPMFTMPAYRLFT